MANPIVKSKQKQILIHTRGHELNYFERSRLENLNGANMFLWDISSNLLHPNASNQGRNKSKVIRSKDYLPHGPFWIPARQNWHNVQERPCPLVSLLAINGLLLPDGRPILGKWYVMTMHLKLPLDSSLLDLAKEIHSDLMDLEPNPKEIQKIEWIFFKISRKIKIRFTTVSRI